MESCEPRPVLSWERRRYCCIRESASELHNNSLSQKIVECDYVWLRGRDGVHWG